jgi:hypothetical protein
MMEDKSSFCLNFLTSHVLLFVSQSEQFQSKYLEKKSLFESKGTAELDPEFMIFHQLAVKFW